MQESYKGKLGDGAGDKSGDESGDGSGDGIYDEWVTKLGEQGHGTWPSGYGEHVVGYLMIITVLPP